MRRSASLISIALGAVLVAPLAAHASVIPFWGPIVPNLTCGSGATYQISPLAWGALIPIINNIIAFALTIAIMFILPLIIAYGGFLYLTSGADPSNRSKANSAITNAIIGIIVALAAWIIVDMVMAALFNPAGIGVSNWYSIVTSSGDPCLSVAGSLNSATLSNGQSATITGSGSDNGTLYSYGQGAACNAQTIEAADPGIPSNMANELACIAQGESTCGTKNQNYCWNKSCGSSGKASTAYGPYQVLLSSNSSCYENNLCYQAAGVSGPLNCKSAFTPNGYLKTDPASQQLQQTCQRAASDIGCSAAAAQCLLSQQSFQSAYGTDKYASQCASGG